jgi:hypothetical protein
MRIPYFLIVSLLACVGLLAMAGCTARNDIATKIYTGPCWMDPDTTGP